MRLESIKEHKKHNAHSKKKYGVCQLPNCDKEFFGDINQKYCDDHKGVENINYRKSILKGFEEKEKLNHYFTSSDFRDTPYIREFKCDCCNKPYKFLVSRDRKVYPRFCSEHRNRYKRERYLNLNKEM